MKFAISTFIFQKFGSRLLIDTLHSLGVCASYAETAYLQLSAILSPPLRTEGSYFVRYVFDNADFNSRTIDGYNTFQAMGGIEVLMPKKALVPGVHFTRLKTRPTAKEVGFGTTALQYFEKVQIVEATPIKVLDLNDFKNVSTKLLPSGSEILWLYGQYAEIDGFPGWGGFMDEVTCDIPFETAFISCLPFVYSDPSNDDTIYTALLSAVQKCKNANQEKCFVTFDLPLHNKAQDIICNSKENPEFQKVALRLGGFHLLETDPGNSKPQIH